MFLGKWGKGFDIFGLLLELLDTSFSVLLVPNCDEVGVVCVLVVLRFCSKILWPSVEEPTADREPPSFTGAFAPGSLGRARPGLTDFVLFSFEAGSMDEGAVGASTKHPSFCRRAAFPNFE